MKRAYRLHACSVIGPLSTRVYAKACPCLQTQHMQGSDSLVRYFRFLKRGMEETDWRRMAIWRR